jgi:hypothetical protein
VERCDFSVLGDSAVCAALGSIFYAFSFFYLAANVALGYHVGLLAGANALERAYAPLDLPIGLSRVCWLGFGPSHSCERRNLLGLLHPR